MRKRRRRRRIRDVVRRYIDGLHRRDRPVPGRGDPFLQVTHFRRQRRLVSDGARHAAEERRHLRTRLREAENVVDEDEHVRALLVAEILGDGQPGEADTQSRARRLVHLTIDERHLVEDPRLLELEVEVVALTRALAHPTEHRPTAVALGDVVDQLLDDHCLADAGAAEEPDLSALDEGRDEIHDLDARLEDFGLRLERCKVGALAVDRPAQGIGRDRRAIVDRFAEHVENAAERGSPDRHRDRTAGVDRLHAPLDTVRRRHADRAHLVAADVLLHLGDDLARADHDDDRVVELGEVVVLELDVEDGSDDLDDAADGGGSGYGGHERMRRK